MQPQTRTNVGAETSTGRSQINATYVLSHMNDFSRDFKRPVSKTTTPQPFLGIAPVVYDVYYPVIHYPPQWIGDERELRKRKVNTEQRQSQRELSNVVGHTNKLANSFMKLETGLLNLRFDKKGSVPLIKQLAAGQRIALRIYLQNEITKQAADLGLVKLGECETLAIRDVVKSMVDRRRTITQAESNVFADEIFEDEVEFDNRDESGEAHIEPYLKRSEEIRNEISDLIWNLQFDHTFARTMSHLLPLNYDSWKEKIITPTNIRKRRRMRRIKRVESADIDIRKTISDYLVNLNWTLETNEEGIVCLRQTFPPDIRSFSAHIASTTLTDLDIITFCGSRGYLPTATAAGIVQGWNHIDPNVDMSIQGCLPVTQHIASTQNAYGAWEMPRDAIVAPPPRPAFDHPLPYTLSAPPPGAPLPTSTLPPPPPWSTGMMAGYWSQDNESIEVNRLVTQFDRFDPTSFGDANNPYVPGVVFRPSNFNEALSRSHDNHSPGWI